MEQLLCHLQQVLETHEVNWKHVLCFLSTLLVYSPRAQPSLRGKLRATRFYLLENTVCHYFVLRMILTILMEILKCTVFKFKTSVIKTFHSWFLG